MQLRVVETNLIIAKDLKVANKTLDRMIGLMFAHEMKGFDALLIKPCNSIHTFFMKYAIDIIFTDKKGLIIKVIRNIAPWKMTRMYFKAKQVYEFVGGSIDQSVSEGQTIEVLCIN